MGRSPPNCLDSISYDSANTGRDNTTTVTTTNNNNDNKIVMAAAYTNSRIRFGFT
jgi:hypothetical protein